MRAPFSLSLYRALTALGTPLAVPFLSMRLRRGKEDGNRLGERRGRAGLPRPAGRLVWLHGASVGEAVSLLPFVERIARAGATALVTTGTVTSAALLAQRLPAGALHQYAPLDNPFFLRRFLLHWRPDAALVAESELWPNMIVETKRAGLPLAMVNGRISERSFNRWRRAPRLIGALLARFDLCLARSEADGERLAALGRAAGPDRGRHQVRRPGAAGRPPRARRAFRPHVRPADLDRRLDPRRRGADRRARAQGARRGVPRRAHPDRAPASRKGRIDPARDRGRGPAMRPALARGAARAVARRSTSATRSASSASSTGSRASSSSANRFAGGGGQNPIEPARLASAILHGPMVGNFADAYAALDASGGALEVDDPSALGAALIELFADGARLRAMARAAGDTVERRSGAVERSMKALAPMLPGGARL